MHKANLINMCFIETQNTFSMSFHVVDSSSRYYLTSIFLITVKGKVLRISSNE